MPKSKKAIVEYRNYFLPANFPVLLLTGDYWKISNIPSGRLHFHNCLEIGVCHSDGGIIELYGEPITFQEGDVTIIPRNIPHTTYSNPGTESLWSYLFFDPQELFRNLLPGSWQNHDLSIYANRNFQHILNRSNYPAIYQLAMNIIYELREKLPGYQISSRGLLLSLYVELYRIENMVSSDTQEPDNALVIAPALDYIENNYMQQFSIDYLADLCHWSPTHFRRVFHSIMGVSPLEYLNNTRVMKSCNLLRSTEESILDISEMSGFHSVSSYNRYFFRIMQMSPREYRKQMLLSDKRAANQSILEYAGWTYPE